MVLAGDSPATTAESTTFSGAGPEEGVADAFTPMGPTVMTWEVS